MGGSSLFLDGTTVLLLGGSRFFGRTILSELLASGARVVRLTRGLRDQDHPPQHPNLICLHGDRNDAVLLADIRDRYRPRLVVDNILYHPDGARMMETVFAGACDLLLFTSTVMSYLNATLSGVSLREEQWERSVHAEGMEAIYGDGEIVYGQNKRQCEDILSHSKALPSLILRLHNVAGEDDFSGKSSLIPRALWHAARAGRPLYLRGTPDHSYQQVWAGDMGRVVCGLLRRFVEQGRAGLADAYNVALPPIRMGDYLALLLAGISTPPEIRWVGEGIDRDNPNILTPYPRNVRLDPARLVRDLAPVALTPYADWLPLLMSEAARLEEGG